MAEAPSSETWGQDFVTQVWTRAVSGCTAKTRFNSRSSKILGAADWKKLKYVLFPLSILVSCLDMFSTFFDVHFNFVLVVSFLPLFFVIFVFL